MTKDPPKKSLSDLDAELGLNKGAQAPPSKQAAGKSLSDLDAELGFAQAPPSGPFVSAPSAPPSGAGGAASAGIPRPAATASPSMQGGGAPASASERRIEPFRGEMVTERQPEMLPGALKGQASAPIQQPPPARLTDSEKTQIESRINALRNDFTPGMVEEKRRLREMLAKDAELDVAPERQGRGTPAENRAYSMFQTMDLPMVQEYIQRKAPAAIAELRKTESVLSHDIQDLERRRNQVEQLGLQARAMGTEDAYRQYEAEVNRYNATVGLVRKQQEQAKGMLESMRADAKQAMLREQEIKSSQGTWLGAMYNRALDGVGQAVSGFNTLLMEPIMLIDPPKVEGGETQEQAKNRVRKDIREAMRTAPKEMVGSEGTTEEYTRALEERSLLASALLGVAGTVPVAFMGPGGMGLMLQASDNTMQEMEGEDFADIPEWKKQVFSSAVGAIVGQLEKAGFRDAVTGGKIARSILGNAMAKAPAGSSAEALKRLIAAETDSYIANAASRALGASASEAWTEGLQAVAEYGAKDIFNMIEEKSLMPDEREGAKPGFETPDGLSEYAKDVVKQMAAGAIGGAVMRSPAEVRDLMRKGLGKSMTDTDFSALEGMLKDDGIAEVTATALDKDVDDGAMTRADADAAKLSWKEAREIVESIPPDIPIDKRREAFDLLAEKRRMSKIDKALVGDRVLKIDEKLAALVGELKTEEAAAKPEPTAAEERVVEEAPAAEEAAAGTVAEEAAPAPVAEEIAVAAEEQPVTPPLSEEAITPQTDAVPVVQTGGLPLREEAGGGQEVRAAQQGPAAAPAEEGQVADFDARVLEDALSMDDSAFREKYALSRIRVLRDRIGELTSKQAVENGLAVAWADAQKDKSLAKRARMDSLLESELVQRMARGEYPSPDGLPTTIEVGGRKTAFRMNDAGGVDLFGIGGRKKTPIRTFSTIEDAIEWAVEERVPSTKGIAPAPREEGQVAPVPAAAQPEGPVRPEGEPKKPKKKEDERAVDERRDILRGGVYESIGRSVLEQDESKRKSAEQKAAPEAEQASPRVQTEAEGAIAWKRKGAKPVERPTAISDPDSKTRVEYSIPGFEDIPIVAVKAEGGWRSAIRVGDTDMLLGDRKSAEGTPSFAAAHAWRVLEKNGMEKVEAVVEQAMAAQKVKEEGPKEQRAPAKDQAFNGPEQPKTPIGDTKTVTVDGKERTVFNSNGKPIHPTVEGVRNFWRWFGDSKVVDEQGRPLVVYHGTRGDFDVADTEGRGKTAGAGMFFTTSPDVATTYSGINNKASVMAVYLRMNDVFRVDAEGGTWGDLHNAKVVIDGLPSNMTVESVFGYASSFTDKLGQALKKSGFDGGRIDNVFDLGPRAVPTSTRNALSSPSTVFIAQAPGQIKSATGNYGTFDPSKPSILEQRPSERPAKSGKPNLDKALKALSNFGVSINIHDTKQAYADAVKDIAQGIESTWGVYDPVSNAIHVNKAATTDLKQTFFHETAHPIIDALIRSNPDLAAKFSEEVVAHPNGQKYLNHMALYSDQSAARQVSEVIAEFMGDVAAGRVPVSSKPDSLWQKFKAFIQDILAALGWDTRSIDLSKPDNVREFAAQFKKAMEKGIRITGLEPVSGTTLSLQDDANRLVDGWYSRLDQAVAAKGSTMPASQWKTWLDARAKEGMLSLEEAKWTGLNDFLASKGNEKVTPQQVHEFLKENRVKVEVKQYGGDGATETGSSWTGEGDLYRSSTGYWVQKSDDGRWKVYDDNGFIRYVPSLEAAKSFADESARVDALPTPTKFSQYQLPGGTNYREIAITLPGPEKYRVPSAHSMGEEADVNRVLHLRLNDRTGPNGEKVLFIEELQSDWGQVGKKKGFRAESMSKEGSDEIASLRKAAEESAVKYQAAAKAVASERSSLRLRVRKKHGYENVLDFARLPDGPQKRAIIEEMDAAASVSERIKELEAEAQKLRSEASDAQDRLIVAQEKARAIEETPPLAPFVELSDAWVELGIKQAIRMAVDGGYDRIAWTTGEQQYNRWGSQVFSWTKRGDNWYVLGQEQVGGDAFAGMEEQLSEQAFSEGRQVESRDDLRELVLATMGREKKDWSPENWKKHIDKITDGIWQQMMDGKDGSTMPRREGMKGFYDKILPTVAKKVSKRLGGDGVVGDVLIDDVRKSEAPATYNQEDGYQPGDDVEFGVGKTPQQSISITPAMRERVGLGVPLMQRPKTTKAKEWNAAVDDAVANNLSKGPEQAIADAAELITDPDGKQAFIDAMNAAWGVTTPPLGTKANQKKASQQRPGKVKKTFTTKRAYEGDFREDVKKELEKGGLFRDIENQAEAEKRADDFIAKVGVDAALDAVRAGDVRGGAASVIRVRALEALDKEFMEETDAEALADIARRTSELIQENDRILTEAGREASMMNRLYQGSDLGFKSEIKAQEWKKQFGEEPSAELMEKWKQRDKEFAELEKKLKEAEERAKKAEEQAAVESIKESIARERRKTRTFSEKSKQVADKFRRLKTQPMVFKDANGNVIEVKEMGFNWNELVEIGAKAIEKTGELADGIAAIAQKLKESGFFANMSDRDMRAVMEQIEERFRAINEEDVDDGRIRIPKQMIRDAVEAGAEDIDTLVAVIKDQLKEDYPDATDRQIRDAITNYGRVVNMRQDEISVKVRRLKDVGRIVSALEDIEQKKRPLRSGLQRDKMDAEQRALHKKLREALKDLPVDEETHQRELKTALDAAKTRASNRIEDLQRAIDMRERIRKSEKRVEPDAELEALNRQKEELQKEYDEIFERPELTQEERLRMAVENARRSLDNIQRRIAERDLEPKAKAPIQPSQELSALREELDKARAEFRRLQEEAGIIERRRLESVKKTTRASIAELERRLRERDFSKKERKPVVADTELERLRAEKIRLKEEYDKEFYKESIKQRDAAQIAKDLVWEAWGFARAIKATAEISFVLIQGGNLTISNLYRNRGAVADAFRNMWNAMRSEKKSDEWLRKVKAQEWYPVAKEAKLAITEPHAELTAREELFVSDWTRIFWNMIGSVATLPARAKSAEAYKNAREGWAAANPFRALERGAVAYLDTLRIERFMEGMQVLEAKKNAGQDVTKEDYRDVADAINTLTGRGSLGPFEQFSKNLSLAFFSPRMWSSQIKVSTPYALYYFYRMRPTARKMALSDLGRSVGTTVALVAMAAAYLNGDDDDETSVELDPRSSDFGKVKLGNVRVDPWGGKIQQVVFSTRMTLGIASFFLDKPLNAYRDKNGKLLPLGSHGAPTVAEVATRMATNKLSPATSMIVEAASSRVTADGTRKVYGQEYDLEQKVIEAAIPIYWETVGELLKDDPNALDGFLLLYAFLGGGVGVQEPTKAKQKRPQRPSRPSRPGRD